MKYNLMRGLLRLSLAGFFRRIDIQGRGMIPARGPVLFVANHTNAFIDPLAVLTGIERRVTITAKHTLAANPLVAVVIYALDVILFRRAVDRSGRGDPGSNASALAACVAELRSGGAVLIFPEGISHSDPAMRPFKLGAAKIVAEFLAAEPVTELWIVPVGLHYTAKSKWRSEAVALIGEPVAARAAAGPLVDVTALTSAMRGWIEALTVNFSSPEERDLLSGAGRLLAYQPDGPQPLDRREGLDARAHVALVRRLQRGSHQLRVHHPARFEELASTTRALLHDMDSLGVTAAEVSLPMHVGRAALFVLREVEVFLVGAPLALVGAVLHWVPFACTRAVVVARSTDEDHPASNAAILSVPIFLAWWLALGVTVWVVLSPWWALVTAVALPYTGLVHLKYRDRAGNVLRRVRTFLLWWWRPDLRIRLEDRIQHWQHQVQRVEAELIGPN